MTPLAEAFGWLAFTLACGAGVTVIAGVMIADLLDERDRRRTGHVPYCTAPRGWSCTCPPR